MPPTDLNDLKVDLGATQEVAIAPPPEAFPPVQTSGQAEPEIPLFELAKQLGEPYWKKIQLTGLVDGKAVTTYDGPGWLLAGLMAGSKLDEHSLITKSKLLELGEEAASISIGVHTHDLPATPMKKEG